MIHPGAIIHPSAVIDEPCSVGEGTRVWHFAHLREHCVVGARCILGQGVYVDRAVRVGDGCKVQNNVSLYEGVTLEEGVFVGPSAVFTNVIDPRAFLEKKHEFRPTLVRRGATIGANATIVCGVTLGEHCFVGAGAVVTRDVPAFALVLGNPARQRGWVGRDGDRLTEEPGGELADAAGRRYRRAPEGLVLDESS